MSAVLPRHVRLELRQPLRLLALFFVLPISYIRGTTRRAERGETKSDAAVDEVCSVAQEVW